MKRSPAFPLKRSHQVFVSVKTPDLLNGAGECTTGSLVWARRALCQPQSSILLLLQGVSAGRCFGTSAQEISPTSRNPIKPILESGSRRKRAADLQFFALLHQQPPRITLSDPFPAPKGQFDLLRGIHHTSPGTIHRTEDAGKMPDFLGLNRYEVPQKSASKIGSMTSFMAIWATGSEPGFRLPPSRAFDRDSQALR